ncbi:MAG: prepilin-type N-terminal cleavage/methylation domain-containing protein [Deltaproteobacteria bacterium]|nr:prepilin-type N-terminal cleavage/methylation domain-containing protein [Deltaproteobacteria bacterium]
MRARTFRQAPGGFTLIEVVLALSIFALMGTILYGAFSLSHSAVEKSQASFDRNRKLRSSTDLMGSYIRSSYPFRPSAENPAVFFDGQENQLTFVSSISLAMGGRGMSKVRILWEGAEQGQGAIKLEEEVPVRVSEDGEDSDNDGHRNDVVLEEGVKDFRLAYLDPTREDEKWEERWDGKEKRALPRAVRLSYRNHSGKEVRWVFPVMITVLTQ